MKKIFTLVAVLIFKIVLPTVSIAQTIAGGDTHSLSICVDGSVMSWGEETNGSLGDNGTNNQYVGVKVHGAGNVGNLSGVVAIAAGGQGQSRALKGDGTVWSWGKYTGDGTANAALVPVQISSLSGITNIACGTSHSIARKNDGTLWAWGTNNHGELGIGTTASNNAPQQITALTGMTAIEAGGFHTLAIKSDKTVWAWGENTYGELGDGTASVSGCYCKSSPVQVSGLTNVIAIAAGGSESSMALKGDGTVWAWGKNNYGQLGVGYPTTSLTPVQVSGLSGIKAISCGNKHCLALKNDGTVWAWGDNGYGQCGDNTKVAKHTPVQVVGLSGVVAISAGGDHCLALKSNGTVWTWGYNNSGQLGNLKTAIYPCICDSSAGSTVLTCVVKVGIDEMQVEKGVRIFPNPAASTLTVQLPENLTGKVSYQIYDVLGRSSFTQTEITNPISDINIESLQQGIYFFQIQTQNGSITLRFVKE